MQFFNKSNCFLALAFALQAMLCPTADASLFNINNAFIANEAPEPGTETNPFSGPLGGTITLGYYATPGSFGTFSTAGMIQTDAFNGNPNIEGQFIPNNIIVPAALVNTALAPLVLNFGGTILGEEILLHPGNPGGDGFVLPASEAVVRYTVPANGQYAISGAFRDIAGGPVAVDVLLNGTSILTVGAGSDATTFSEIETLSAGDFLDFVVDDADGIGSDSTGLFANIAAVPEPSTLVLTAFGALGLLIAARRRAA